MTFSASDHSKHPLFSIVIPTRNRARLLQYALQSVMEQTFEDYEIVISDNASSDNTAQVVEEWADRRIRYIRTPEPLSQADSWEFALNHARGEYVTFLGDDDALCPGLLVQVAECRAPVVTWELGLYHSDRSTDPGRLNAVEFCSFDRQIRQLDSQTELVELFGGFRLLDQQKWPILNNAAYHRDVIARVKKRLSRFFHPLVSDLSSCIATLTQVDHYPHIRDLLALKALGNETFSRITFTDAERQTKLRSEFVRDAHFEHVPLKSTTAANSVYETLLIMNEKLEPETRVYQISWVNYFVSCYADLLRLQLLFGTDVSADLSEFERALALQPSNVIERVRSATAPGRLEKLVALEGSEHKFWVIHGKDVGFNNILECARVLNDSLRGELAQFWSGHRDALPIKVVDVTQSTWLWGVAPGR